LDDVAKPIKLTIKLIRNDENGYLLEVAEIIERERPAILSLPEYPETAK
jgi:hypothetical protein